MKINNAIIISNQVFEKIKDKLDDKYLKVEINNLKNFLSLKCHLTNSVFMEFRLLEDIERNRIKLPNSVKEYYSKGGSEKLTEEFQQYNKDAWKCEVKKHLENNKIMEFGIVLNERNFTEESLLELLTNYFLKQ